MGRNKVLGLMIAALVGSAAPATMAADAVSIEAMMAPKESLQMSFDDGTTHLVLLMRREGKAEGDGALAGADVTEFGWHDVDPPAGANAHGYLQFKATNGDIANIKWTVRAVFFKGEEKPTLANYGYWELVSGTGQFANSTGVGTLTIKSVSKTDRLFTLSGEMSPRP